MVDRITVSWRMADRRWVWLILFEPAFESDSRFIMFGQADRQSGLT
jgi:hypothetical protein